MKTKVLQAVALGFLALVLLGCGGFGVADHLLTKPGFDRARQEQKQYGGEVGKALDKQGEGLERSRNIAVLVSLALFVSGLVLAGFAIKGVIRPGGGRAQERTGACAVCGAVISGDHLRRGVCASCQSRE